VALGVCGEQQATMLREDLPGFVFESNRGTKHSFTAETTMGPEFAAGWTGHRHKKFRSKTEETRQKVSVCSVGFYYYCFFIQISVGLLLKCGWSLILLL